MGRNMQSRKLSNHNQDNCKVKRMVFKIRYPEKVVADNEPQFVAKEFERFCQEYGICQIRASPYHPQTNGLAERMVDTFKRRTTDRYGKITEVRQTSGVFTHIPESTPLHHGKVTSRSLMNRRLLTFFDNIRPNGRDDKERREQYKKGPSREFTEKERIWFKRWKRDKWHEGTINIRTGLKSYWIQNETENNRRCHSDFIRKRIMDKEETSQKDRDDSRKRTSNEGNIPPRTTKEHQKRYTEMRIRIRQKKRIQQHGTNKGRRARRMNLRRAWEEARENEPKQGDIPHTGGGGDVISVTKD